ncbi:hypothetical protein QE152_g37099 [Popillia japonica]|uniref:Uncharacterized protein n=1 Tax=Popillia japonica TaxID=7064 RepID=A0AAW1IBI0_POPJA
MKVFDSEMGPEHGGDSSSSSTGSDIEENVDQQYRKNKQLKLDDYCWKTTTFTPEIHLFDDTNCGLDKNIPNFESITIFEHFMWNEIIDKIIAEIRNYKIFAIETKVVKDAEKFNVPSREEMYRVRQKGFYILILL